MARRTTRHGSGGSSEGKPMTAWLSADPAARLDDPDEARPPRETTHADAQADVNFVVFEPEWLPGDCSIGRVTCRPEQPPGRPDDVTPEELGQTPWSEGNPSSVRTVVEGEGRRLRLKQFLYDWAPPAASVAPLWRTPDPTPFDCGDAVGWLGRDYEDRRGACVQRDRTQVELSVLDGEFGDRELRKLLRGVAPAAPDAAAAVRDAPFHRLNYWVRYRCEPVAVPHGLWEFSPVRPYDGARPLSPVALARDPPVRPLLPRNDGYVFDSAVAFPDADAIECVFRRRGNGSDHLWLAAAAEGSPFAPDLPPEPADQSAETRRALDRRGTTVHYAALTEERGAWEAFWAEDGVRYAAWAGSSQLLDGDGFEDLVGSLAAP
ncbi:hypothetical protein [Halorarum salinum]|uniref:Uncharacterized protein n=1 Tax=Halorarum salinum TaxID=2743089 RepID=A0A7D5LAE6_9EURY|nr:hypothetical protein [Halobaculum salinum]QLG61848.1 hypothetical protein HUG12_08960 [Halobaculum salinum]